MSRSKGLGDEKPTPAPSERKATGLIKKKKVASPLVTESPGQEQLPEQNDPLTARCGTEVVNAASSGCAGDHIAGATSSDPSAEKRMSIHAKFPEFHEGALRSGARPEDARHSAGIRPGQWFLGKLMFPALIATLSALMWVARGGRTEDRD